MGNDPNKNDFLNRMPSLTSDNPESLYITDENLGEKPFYVWGKTDVAFSNAFQVDGERKIFEKKSIFFFNKKKARSLLVKNSAVDFG